MQSSLCDKIRYADERSVALTESCGDFHPVAMSTQQQPTGPDRRLPAPTSCPIAICPLPSFFLLSILSELIFSGFRRHTFSSAFPSAGSQMHWDAIEQTGKPVAAKNNSSLLSELSNGTQVKVKHEPTDARSNKLDL